MCNWNKGPLLGRGSTAIVSLASDPTSGKLFAVKSTTLSNSAFLQYEKIIHSSISSPHIISYLGYDSDDHFYNLFLEYASGGSISDLIQKQKLQESEIKSFVKDILLGLSHLHSMKIAHCDIKCQNILISGDGRAKIADLGCAKFIDYDTQISAKLRGTPMFMAPEVARGEEQGLASDVWALGCTIIETASGRAPWLNVSDAASLLYRVGFTDDLPEIPDCVSDECKDFLSKCLVKDAGNRATVDELLMHPFITGMGMDIGYKRVTPRSILENSVWDTVSNTEAEIDFGCNRILDLIGSEDGPEWSWDDSWQTVRNESLSTCVTAAPTREESLEFSNYDHELCDYSDVNYMDRCIEEGVNVSKNCTINGDDDVELILSADNKISGLIETVIAMYAALISYGSKMILLCIVYYMQVMNDFQLRLKTNIRRLENPAAFDQL